MSTILNGIQLPAGIVHTDRNAYSSVTQDVNYTLGGRAVIFYGEYLSGTPITLSSLEDQGWATLDVVTQLQLIALTPGGVFSLTLEGVEFQVMFRHNEAPAFSAAPLIPRSAPLPSDFFTISIKLLTV